MYACVNTCIMYGTCVLLYVWVHMCMCGRVCVCMGAYVYVWAHVCVWTSMCMCGHVCMCGQCLYVCMCGHVCVYVCVSTVVNVVYVALIHTPVSLSVSNVGIVARLATLGLVPFTLSVGVSVL